MSQDLFHRSRPLTVHMSPAESPERSLQDYNPGMHMFLTFYYLPLFLILKGEAPPSPHTHISKGRHRGPPLLHRFFTWSSAASMASMNCCRRRRSSPGASAAIITPAQGTQGLNDAAARQRGVSCLDEAPLDDQLQALAVHAFALGATPYRIQGLTWTAPDQRPVRQSFEA